MSIFFSFNLEIITKHNTSTRILSMQQYTLPSGNVDFSVYYLINISSIMNIFTEKPRILAFWSHRIERAIIDYRLRTDVYVGFQKSSRFAPVIPQYEKMDAIARSVWIFGELDARYSQLSDTFRFVDLSRRAALRREWFVVVNTPEYARALVAHEITDPDTPQDERLFQGVLTSDTYLIGHIERRLRDLTQTLNRT
jgi:hypothetical protein